MRINPKAKVTCLVALAMALLPLTHTQARALNDEKPFAEKHVIMQVSRGDGARQGLVLDIANNLAKHYGGQDMVDVEIIAFGAGVPIVFADNNPNQARVQSLMAHGVRFYVCGNTLDTLERRDGDRPELLPGVETVQTGVAFMIDEVDRGYTHVHP